MYEDWTSTTAATNGWIDLRKNVYDDVRMNVHTGIHKDNPFEWSIWLTLHKVGGRMTYFGPVGSGVSDTLDQAKAHAEDFAVSQYGPYAPTSN